MRCDVIALRRHCNATSLRCDVSALRRQTLRRDELRRYRVATGCVATSSRCDVIALRRHRVVMSCVAT